MQFAPCGPPLDRTRVPGQSARIPAEVRAPCGTSHGPHCGTRTDGMPLHLPWTPAFPRVDLPIVKSRTGEVNPRRTGLPPSSCSPPAEIARLQSRDLAARIVGGPGSRRPGRQRRWDRNWHQYHPVKTTRLTARPARLRFPAVHSSAHPAEPGCRGDARDAEPSSIREPASARSAALPRAPPHRSLPHQRRRVRTPPSRASRSCAKRSSRPGGRLTDCRSSRTTSSPRPSD